MDGPGFYRRHPSTSSCPVHYYLGDDGDYNHHRFWGATSKIDSSSSSCPKINSLRHLFSLIAYPSFSSSTLAAVALEWKFSFVRLNAIAIINSIALITALNYIDNGSNNSLRSSRWLCKYRQVLLNFPLLLLLAGAQEKMKTRSTNQTNANTWLSMCKNRS